ncbi:MAG: coenzyme A pyrophosphatase [Deltaproteobacteria bacterium]|nr:coenzyme A pyrophosphatase [Deltaproteobacteria bacterium]HCH63712.1 CoA pyrophosphatase [Deltaproteobacteria bacterium]
MNALHTMVELRRVLAARPGQALPPKIEVARPYAAVAAVLRDSAQGVQVLLIRRAEHPGDPWSGHMALPGGRREPSDATLMHTAMRETAEELGLRLTADQVIGSLDDLEAVARGRRVGMVIRPFVFHWEAPELPELVPNREVAEALWTPLLPIHRGDCDTTRPFEMDGVTYALPGWDVRGRVVWGLTHRILSDLLERM